MSCIVDKALDNDALTTGRKLEAEKAKIKTPLMWSRKVLNRLTETISKGKNLMFNNKTKGKKPKPKGEEGEDHAASEEDGELGECSA